MSGEAWEIQRAGLVVSEAAGEARRAAEEMKGAAKSLDWATARLREERQAAEQVIADLQAAIEKLAATRGLEAAS